MNTNNFSTMTDAELASFINNLADEFDKQRKVVNEQPVKEIKSEVDGAIPLPGYV